MTRDNTRVKNIRKAAANLRGFLILVPSDLRGVTLQPSTRAYLSVTLPDLRDRLAVLVGRLDDVVDAVKAQEHDRAVKEAVLGKLR